MIRTGVMLATAATGLLVGSPLAYAACNKDDQHGHTKGDHGHRGGGHDGDKPARHESKSGDCNGSVNQVNSGRSMFAVNIAVPVKGCDTHILSGVFGIFAHDLRNNDNR